MMGSHAYVDLQQKAHTLIQKRGSKPSERDGEDGREGRGPRADHNRTFCEQKNNENSDG